MEIWGGCEAALVCKSFAPQLGVNGQGWDEAPGASRLSPAGMRVIPGGMGALTPPIPYPSLLQTRSCDERSVRTSQWDMGG